MHSLVVVLSGVSTLAASTQLYFFTPPGYISVVAYANGGVCPNPNLPSNSKHYADLVVRPATFASSLLWGDLEVSEGCFLQYVSRKKKLRCAKCPCGVCSVIFDEWCPRGVLVPALSLTLRHRQNMNAQMASYFQAMPH